MSSFCIYCWGKRAVRACSYLREWKEVGVKGGQCHTKGGQEGKISHPWSVRQRILFWGGFVWDVGMGGGSLEPWTNKYLVHLNRPNISTHVYRTHTLRQTSKLVFNRLISLIYHLHSKSMSDYILMLRRFVCIKSFSASLKVCIFHV